jgi:hypothetical protein
VALHETRAFVAIVATAMLRNVVGLLWVKVVHRHQHIKILWATFEAKGVKVAKHSGGGTQSTNTENCAPPHPIKSFALRFFLLYKGDCVFQPKQPRYKTRKKINSKVVQPKAQVSRQIGSTRHLHNQKRIRSHTTIFFRQAHSVSACATVQLWL